MLKLNQIVKPKIFWPSIIVLSALSISFYVLKENEEKLKIDTQQQLDRTVLGKKVVENKLEETTIAKNMLQEELTVEKEKASVLERTVKEKEHEVKLALEKLEKEVVARRETEAQLIITLKEKGILEVKVSELSKRPKAVELERIVVKTTPTLIGSVLMVNKDYDFVVVDLGRENNIKPGGFLSVYRDDRFIGRVQVERVEERVCAAAILPEWQDAEFMENDAVREI